ncbi:MAG: hypothetical protein ACO2ON_03955 [Candidatus Nanopusillus sp.]
MVEWKITNIVFSIRFNITFLIDKMVEIFDKNRVPVDYAKV